MPVPQDEYVELPGGQYALIPAGTDPSAREAMLTALQQQFHPAPPSLSDRIISGIRSVPGESMIEDAVTAPLELVKGAGRGVVSTATDLGQLARTLMPDQAAAESMIPTSLLARGRELATPANKRQAVGKGIEQAAEFAVPADAVDRGVLKLTTAVLPKTIGNTAARMAVNAGELGTRMAAQAPVGAATATVRGEDPVTGGIVASTGPVLGAIGEGAAPVLKIAGRQMVRSALKTPVSLLNKGGAMVGKTATSKVGDVVDTVINNRLSSADAAEKFIQDQEAKLDVPVDTATAAGVTTNAPQRAQQYLRDAQQRLRGVASTPTERMNALKSEAEALLSDPNGSHGHDVLVPGGTTTQRTGNIVLPVQHPPITIRELRTDMTPRETLNSARAADTTWDATRPAATAQAKKVTEVAERDALKDAVPEAGPILEQQGHGIVAKKVLDRADVRHGNLDLISLGAMASGGPLGLAHQVIRMSGVKGGILVDQLAEAANRNDVRLVSEILTKMGYGAALDSLPKQEGPP